MEHSQSLERRENTFISLQNLVKVYPNGEKAVYNFDLDIDKNEFIVIVGPSGCGKSTTLRMIAGLEDISDGDIYLEGELLNYKPSNERRMAMVFQSYALYPQMNVYNNIAFPLTINKYPMPIVNGILLMQSELDRLFDSLTPEEFAQTMWGYISEKVRSMRKEERIAVSSGISYDSAVYLWKKLSLAKFADEQDILSRYETFTKEFRSELDAMAEAERAGLKKQGVVLNEQFMQLDKDGNVKTELRKYTDFEIKTRVFETAEKLDLIPYLDKLPKELSGGQMQRVALGRAIVKNVPIFLMDEPLSNLDAKLRMSMRSEIVKIHNRFNATTIYVTHDQTEAMTMASRIVVMSKGFIQQIGTPTQVYNDPKNVFVAKFIGAPSMNIFPVMYHAVSGSIGSDDAEIPLGADFKKKHDEFYAERILDFEQWSSDLNEQAREGLFKVLSATGEPFNNKKKQRKKGLIALIRQIVEESRQKKTETDKFAYEKSVIAQKLSQLQANRLCDHQLLLGIRPEKISVIKANGKNSGNGFRAKPTVCELLGGEYNLHFDLFGVDIICRTDADEPITPEDEMLITMRPEDMYIFDPVTGGRIV